MDRVQIAGLVLLIYNKYVWKKWCTITLIYIWIITINLYVLICVVIIFIKLLLWTNHFLLLLWLCLNMCCDSTSMWFFRLENSTHSIHWSGWIVCQSFWWPHSRRVKHTGNSRNPPDSGEWASIQRLFGCSPGGDCEPIRPVGTVSIWGPDSIYIP